MHEEDIKILHTGLLPQGNEPGKGHNEKNQHAEPEVHSGDFSKVPFQGQKCENAETRDDNTNESFRVKG